MELPQNTAEFDAWAREAQVPGNEVDLNRAQAYVHYTTLLPAEARSPLMAHTLTSWRLPSWLPVDRQSARGICRMRQPDWLEQPQPDNTPEHWAQYMHRHLHQWRSYPGLVLNGNQVSLPHIRGFLLIRQQITPGLSQRQKAGLYAQIAEVLVSSGLYHQ